MLTAALCHVPGRAWPCRAGMCLVAEQFPEETARSRALGLVLGSIALGVLLGYPLGSVAYEFLGKPAPFLVVCALAFLLASEY